MGTEEIIHGLSAADAKLDAARNHALAAVQAVNEAHGLVAAQLRGSQAGPLLAILVQVREGMANVARGLDPAKARLRETIGAARALGN